MGLKTNKPRGRNGGRPEVLTLAQKLWVANRYHELALEAAAAKVATKVPKVSPQARGAFSETWIGALADAKRQKALNTLGLPSPGTEDFGDSDDAIQEVANFYPAAIIEQEWAASIKNPHSIPASRHEWIVEELERLKDLLASKTSLPRPKRHYGAGKAIEQQVAAEASAKFGKLVSLRRVIACWDSLGSLMAPDVEHHGSGS